METLLSHRAVERVTEMKRQQILSFYHNKPLKCNYTITIFISVNSYSLTVPCCHHSIGEVFRNSFHPEFPRLTVFLWIVNTSDRWIAQCWGPITLDNWTPKIYVPLGVWVAQLYPQAPGVHFHRLLQFAWATEGFGI